MTPRPFANSVLCITICLSASGGGNRTVLGAAEAATGRVGGHVRDSAGQFLPGVSVTMVRERGGPARHATTDREGAYRLEELADDTYRLYFQLTGFDRTRLSHVRPGPDTDTDVDATLFVSSICECLTTGLSTTPRPLAGQVVDEANRPLLFARVEVVTPKRRETAYTDIDGRFVVRAPLEGAWPITASDTGFASATQQISNVTAGPILLRLRFVGTQSPPSSERFELGCLCPEYFTHRER